MQHIDHLLSQIEEHIDHVLSEDTDIGHGLWRELLKKHPADIAYLIDAIDTKYQNTLFKKLPKEISSHVFKHFAFPLQASILSSLDTQEATTALIQLPTDELIELFDHLSDQNLQYYLKLLQKRQREHIISSLNFAPKSAGRIMNPDVLALQESFTVGKSIIILQHMGAKKELLPRIYITNADNKLMGFIELDDLLVNKADVSLSSIISENELVINVHEDQQTVANQMHHYSLLAVPVVDEQNYFLGVITADDIFDVVEEEASEDVYKMSGLSPVDHTYFHTSFWLLVLQRSKWLIGLLLLQSVSSIIMLYYNKLLEQNLIISMFLTMLIGTGGNAGNQSATLVIRGLATGEMGKKNRHKVLWREFWIALALAVPLVTVCIGRVYVSHSEFLSAITIGIALFSIVVTSIMLGTFIPLVLDRFGIDPALSAAPFLATLMDILGVLILCFVASKVLG